MGIVDDYGIRTLDGNLLEAAGNAGERSDAPPDQLRLETEQQGGGRAGNSFGRQRQSLDE